MIMTSYLRLVVVLPECLFIIGAVYGGLGEYFIMLLEICQLCGLLLTTQVTI